MASHLPQKFGPYTLHELVGRGGMAEIYRATMPGIGGFEKTVAIKKILPHLTENEEFITMLIDEARIIVSINHFNIAQVYDLGKIDDSYYIAMEYIHGVDLATVIKEMSRRNSHVPIPHAIYIGSSICAGLHVAHSKVDDQGNPLNIVHRDVSPHNVLLSFAGDVKLIDFGVAKASVKENHTKMGVIKGKLLYMAPEQAMAKDVDGRSDLFAAGLIMYKMLTNRLPFQGDNEFQIYNNILTKEVVPPRVINPEIPEVLDNIIMKLLARDLDQRYQDGYSAKLDLDRALHQISPGYTVNRLSRFIDENFARPRTPDTGASSSPAGLAPQTPPGLPRDSGPLDLEIIPLDEDSADTVDVGPPRIREEIRAQSQSLQGGPPPALPGQQQRTAVADHQTGEFHIPQATEQGKNASKQRSLTFALIAVAAMSFLLVGLATAAFFLTRDQDDDADALRDRLPPGALVSDEELARERANLPPALVEVVLNSSPEGARVFQEEQLVGITPITLEIEESSEPLTFTFTKEGYEDLSFRIVPIHSMAESITLLPTDEAEDREPDDNDSAGLAATAPKETPDPPAPAPKPERAPAPPPRQPDPQPAPRQEPAPAPKPEPPPKPEPKKEESSDIIDPFAL